MTRGVFALFWRQEFRNVFLNAKSPTSFIYFFGNVSSLVRTSGGRRPPEVRWVA